MTLLIFTLILGIFPLILAGFWLKENSREILYILPFLSVVFIASLYELFCSVILKWNVKYWFIIYNLLVFVSLFYFTYEVLKEFKKLLILFLILFIILITILYLNFNIDDFFVFDSYFKGFQLVFIIVFSILWFRKLFIELKIVNLLDSPVFYFFSGLIIYYSGTFFLFLLNNIIYQNNEKTFQDYWLLNIILNLTLRSLLIVGIWKARVK